MATQDTRTLLLIDDEPAQSRFIAALAAREGFRALVAPTADEGLAILRGPEGGEVAVGGKVSAEGVEEEDPLRPARRDLLGDRRPGGDEGQRQEYKKNPGSPPSCRALRAGVTTAPVLVARLQAGGF